MLVLHGGEIQTCILIVPTLQLCLYGGEPYALSPLNPGWMLSSIIELTNKCKCFLEVV